MTSTAIPWEEARRHLRMRPREFANLVRTGALRRAGERFCFETLFDHHARATEILRIADAQITTIRADAARRLAALGASDQENKG